MTQIQRKILFKKGNLIRTREAKTNKKGTLNIRYLKTSRSLTSGKHSLGLWTCSVPLDALNVFGCPLWMMECVNQDSNTWVVAYHSLKFVIPAPFVGYVYQLPQRPTWPHSSALALVVGSSHHNNPSTYVPTRLPTVAKSYKSLMFHLYLLISQTCCHILSHFSLYAQRPKHLLEILIHLWLDSYGSNKIATKIRSFVGLIGYYQIFIEGFSKITTLLTYLTRKDQPFAWIKICE
ncbi:hypothetical protein CR513_55062, partial [Mucuna pruriens]